MIHPGGTMRTQADEIQRLLAGPDVRGYPI
jgi:hypothetical protein